MEIPHKKDEREFIDDILALTGHELAGQVDWNSEEHLQRLLTMGLLPPPQRSLARFVLQGWLGKNPIEQGPADERA